MGNTEHYVRKVHMVSAAHIAPKKFMRTVHSYYAICIHCGYSGSDWTSSGECPACGEVN